MALLFSGRGDGPAGDFYEIPDSVTSDGRRVFEVNDRISAGGNGVVHKCTDAASGDEFAIKFQLVLREDRLVRFGRERQLLADLKHDHLIVYEDAGTIAGVHRRRREQRRVSIPFLVMELARTNLAQLLHDATEVPYEVYSAQFRGLARALGLLHGKAIHRDIKPENILVVGDRWVLSDYGLCDLLGLGLEERLTPDWMVVGPRWWMSPEASNRSVGGADAIIAASDVFQLASVFWFVVNRSHPTGVLAKSDWSGPEGLFDPIFRALHHCAATRPPDGDVFASEIDAAILSA